MKVQEVNLENVKDTVEKYYLPIELKKELAENIIYQGTDDNYNLDFVDMYYAYVYNVIKNYTNIEYEKSQYDILRQNGVIDYISFELKEDLEEFKKIIKLQYLTYKNKNSLENKIIEFSDNLSNNLDKYLEKIKNKINNVDIKDFDIEKIKNKLFN